MNPQATTTDELTFTRPQGELEKQVLTAEAVEFFDGVSHPFYAKTQ